MDSQALNSLINNAALLLALVVLYDIVFSSAESNTRLKQALVGLFIGLIGMALMLNPWIFMPGLIFDTRSVLLSTAGLFFGAIPTAVAVVATGLFRVYQGGFGILTGVTVILITAGLGVAWRHQRRRFFSQPPDWLELYGFGIAAHIAMLLCMFTLPWSVALDVLRKIGLPVLLIYPVATVLLGKLLAHQTGREEVRKALKASEEKFRFYVEHAPLGLFIADRHGRYVEVNPAAARMLGYEQDELVGLSIPDVLAPEALEAGQRHFATVIAQGSVSTEILHRCKQGSLRWITVDAVRLNDQRHMAFCQDTTERRLAEEKLRLNAAVVASTRDGVIITDLESRILAVNPAYTEITGYHEAEVVGQNPRLLQSGRHGRAFYQAMWASIREMGYWRGELWNRRKNGELYPQWLTISVVRNDQGEATHYIGVLTDISQIKHAEERLDRLAHYDPLTDLPNRRLAQLRLTHAVEQAQRHGYRLGVLFIDLDRFKTVNDSLGHPVGDELLQAIARRLSQRLRQEDTLARLGGDEFLVVLEYLQRPEEAAAVAQILISRLEQPFTLAGGQELYVSASIGISLYPDDGHSAADLIQHADTAVYQAKMQGRNTYRFYTEALTRTAHERLDLESRLRRALERNEFLLHYQPLMSVEEERMIGVEALVRWQPPDEALVPPLRFIPLAEETGLIVPLGEWVLRTACAQAKSWLDAGSPPLLLAVNLSARQFQQPDLIARIQAILTDTGWPVACLELEITESTLMEQGQQAVTTLMALKELGVRLAIDDFGTGYSSLAYLKRFPIDKLKIDQSFVRDIPHDPNDMEIASAIIALAHNLRLEVLAEGVETPDQLAFLRERGCDASQGYLFSRPLPAEELARWLEGYC